MRQLATPPQLPTLFVTSELGRSLLALACIAILCAAAGFIAVHTSRFDCEAYRALRLSAGAMFLFVVF